MKSFLNYILHLSFLFCFIANLEAETSQKESSADKTVLLAILARNKAHVLPKFLECIDRLDYDKKLITVYINTNNNEDQTQTILEDWMRKNEAHYRFISLDAHEVEGINSSHPHDWTPVRFKTLGAIRNRSMKRAKDYNCDYYFVVDCDNFIHSNTLKTLVQKDKPIIAPALRAIPEKNDAYSNYFCDIDGAGYYKTHPDYMKILNRQMVGTFQVPVVHCTYLIQTPYIDKLTYVDRTEDYEFVIFSRSARNNNVDQYICNEQEFGTLLHFYDNPSLKEEKERMEKIDSSTFLLK